jgi:hypothetical protein
MTNTTRKLRDENSLRQRQPRWRPLRAPIAQPQEQGVKMLSSRIQVVRDFFDLMPKGDALVDGSRWFE